MQMSDSEQMALFQDDNSENKSGWFSKALKKLEIFETAGWPDAFGDALSKWNTENISTPIRVLSLFSGAGGLDIGFHDVGFQIVECNEIEESFAETLLENSKKNSRLEGTIVVCSDIKNYSPSFENIDFIIGGPPCQTFSAAGTRAAGVNGTDDDRGNLFWEYVRILDILKPKGFLFENVYRIVGAQGGKPWEQIQTAFQDVGYKLHWRILDAADYGVPQFRERLIIVGLKEGDYQFPFPSHGPDAPDKRKYYTAGEAISNLTTIKSHEPIRGRHGHLLKDIPPGLNYSFYTEKLGHPTPIFGWRSKFSDYLYKAAPDTPTRTIKAQGGQYTGPFHWDNRAFTLDELKRIQTFPDNYLIIGHRQKVIHQLGNSVPPQLARILGFSILQQVFNKELPFELQLMPNSYPLGFRARKRKLTKVYAKIAATAIALLPKVASNEIYEGNGKIFGKLTDDLQLLSLPSPKSADFTLEHTSNKGSWVLNLYEKQPSNNIQYELFIRPTNLVFNNTKIQSIVLRSYTNKSNSVLGLWKYLEKLIKEIDYKDDLVQLFGYYQYKQNYSIKLKISNAGLVGQPFWDILSLVSQGDNIGKILHLSKLAHDYGIPQDDLIKELKMLKKLGFEIRNHNTNKQIEEDMILIPYAFPTLNERSLQRHTEL